MNGEGGGGDGIELGRGVSLYYRFFATAFPTLSSMFLACRPVLGVLLVILGFVKDGAVVVDSTKGREYMGSCKEDMRKGIWMRHQGPWDICSPPRPRLRLSILAFVPSGGGTTHAW